MYIDVGRLMTWMDVLPPDEYVTDHDWEQHPDYDVSGYREIGDQVESFLRAGELLSASREGDYQSDSYGDDVPYDGPDEVVAYKGDVLDKLDEAVQVHSRIAEQREADNAERANAQALAAAEYQTLKEQDAARKARREQRLAKAQAEIVKPSANADS